jgi:PAS domain S-box-containing protein
MNQVNTLVNTARDTAASLFPQLLSIPVLYLLGSDGAIRWVSNRLSTFGLDSLEWLGQGLSKVVQLDPTEPKLQGDCLLREGLLQTPEGPRRVQICETLHDGIPAFGVISPACNEMDSQALAAIMGQVALWRLDLRTLESISLGRLTGILDLGEDASPRRWVEIMHPDDALGFRAQLENIGRDQSSTLEVEARVKQRDGRWLWTLTRGEVSRRDDTGYPIEMVGITLDVSRQKKVENELQDHRTLLRRSLRLARVAAWAYDAKSHDQVWTDEASELLGVPSGYVPEQLLGLELFDGESQVRVQKSLRRALDEGIGFDQELLRITPAGRVLWVRAVANPDFENGEMVRLSGLFQDITRQRRMEQAVRDSEQLLRQLTAGLPDAIFQLRRSSEGSYHLDFLSEGIRPILNLAPDAPMPDFDALARSFLEPNLKTLLRSLDTASAKRELWQQDLIVRSSRRILTGRAQPEPQLDGSCLFFGFFSDVSEQRTQEQALKDIEQSQQRMARLEAVGLLAGGIAHDFNNYLTSIVMSLSLLESQPEVAGEANQLVREALSATSSAQALTRQLLTFSRGALPVKQVVRTEALVREAVAFSLRGSAVECKLAHDDQLWPMEVDPGQVQQIIQNLVLNAAQAMNNSGHLQIQMRNVSADAHHLTGVSRGPLVRIDVIDRGAGVPSAIREKLFQPYVTTKEHGSGLGLASAFSIARRHDGLIGYEANSDGPGSKFSVWLPALPSHHVETPVTAQIIQGSGHVLVVDDNEGILKMMDRALRHLGFSCVCAKDGVEAAKLASAAKHSHSPFTLVVIDQTIPGGVGGADALKLLHAIDPALPAIATSGYTEGETMANYREFGFHGVLRKPFRIQDLSKVLNEVLKP